MFFKNKISLNDLSNTYVGVINYIYQELHFDINCINKISLLLDLYCFLYFGTISNLEKILTPNQMNYLENKIISCLTDSNLLNKLDIEKIKDFNWEFFSKPMGTLLFLTYKLDSLDISFKEDDLYSYSFIMLNNLSGTNSYLKTVKIV